MIFADTYHIDIRDMFMFVFLLLPLFGTTHHKASTAAWHHESLDLDGCAWIFLLMIILRSVGLLISLGHAMTSTCLILVENRRIKEFRGVMVVIDLWCWRSICIWDDLFCSTSLLQEARWCGLNQEIPEPICRFPLRLTPCAGWQVVSVAVSGEHVALASSSGIVQAPGASEVLMLNPALLALPAEGRDAAKSYN